MILGLASRSDFVDVPGTVESTENAARREEPSVFTGILAFVTHASSTDTDRTDSAFIEPPFPSPSKAAAAPSFANGAHACVSDPRQEPQGCRAPWEAVRTRSPPCGLPCPTCSAEGPQMPHGERARAPRAGPRPSNSTPLHEALRDAPAACHSGACVGARCSPRGRAVRTRPAG